MLADRKYPLSLAGLFGLYVAAGKLGLALAAFLTLGYRVWPAILAGAFVVNFSTAGSLATSIAIALGNTLEAFAGAYLVNRYANGVRAFDHAQDVFKFAALAG